MLKNFKGIYLSKALTCMTLFLYKQKLLFIKETDSFGYIVVRTIYTSHIDLFTPQHEGAQWLSGRVLDSRPKGCRFEPHRRHCVVVLEQDTFILA